MTYRQRLPVFIIIDSCILFTAIFMSWFLVIPSINIITYPLIIASSAILLSYHLFSMRLNLYKKVWKYASVGELVIIFKVITYSVLTAVIMQKILIPVVHFRFLIVTWLLLLLLIGGSRFIWRMYRNPLPVESEIRLRTLIIGAGSAGTMVARQLLRDNGNLLPVAFIDDNVKKHQLDILGLPVIGGIKEISRTVKELDIGNIIISIPSLHKSDLNIIFEECVKTSAQTKILPLLEDMLTGKVSATQLRDVRVEDLLGRDPIEMDINSISEFITNRIVLVTGAGGSIGSEISRQITRFNPTQLILLGHGENSIYEIEMELKEEFANSATEFITEIADVKDAKKMMWIMEKHQPDVVYHAAAHKHVPLMEQSPEEAVKNNVIGTRNVAEAASVNRVGTFVMVSTDKAVNPTSVMGATKKIAEMIVQDMDKKSDTKFVAVRFGNVLESRGSVIPLFKRQIKQGGPVTVTHPDMVRYFMTIPEASRLVIQAGALAKGGEIFVLDMGEPVKIVELARTLIKLSGYSVAEIGIEFTGIRPGEKLFEELLTKNEIHEEQLYPKIYIGKTTEIHLGAIDEIINCYSNLDKATLRARLLGFANNETIDEPKSAMLV